MRGGGPLKAGEVRMERWRFEGGKGIPRVFIHLIVFIRPTRRERESLGREWEAVTRGRIQLRRRCDWEWWEDWAAGWITVGTRREE